MERDFFLLALLACGMVVFLITNSFSTRRKQLESIRKNFGRVPNANYKRRGISKYWQTYRAQNPSAEYVDDITWNDLSMEEVFDRIDACQTSIGQDYLYALLHRPCTDPEHLAQREAFIKAFEQEDFRQKVQMILARLGKRAGANLSLVLFGSDLIVLENPWRFLASALSPLMGIPFLFFSFELAIIIFVLTIGHNIWLYFSTRKLLENQLETFSYLMAAFRCGRRLCAATAAQCPAYAAMLEKALLPVKKLGISTAALAPSPQSDLDAFSQMICMVTLLPILQYCKAIKTIRHSQKELLRVYELIGEADAAISILSYRESIDAFTIPTFTDTFMAEGCEIVHPLLANAVPNDASIRQNWLLTGSNASGKSTFIKAVAVNHILAQTIHTCTAKRYCLKPGAVISSMAVEDNIIDGESYFIAEIKSMQRIVALVDSGTLCYCFIDEILKGTNTLERIAASYAVLKHLHRPNCICVAATHDIELTASLANFYENFHFRENFTDAGITFDYKLKQGPSTTRNAIRLLEYYHFPADIIAQANARTHCENL